MMRSLVTLALLLSVINANGQTSSVSPAPIKLGDVTVTGTLRARAYAWDWFTPTSGNDEYQYSGNVLRVNFAATQRSWQWNAELAVPLLLGLPENATGTGPQQGALGLGASYLSANKGNRTTAMLFPRQLYIQFNSLGTEKGHLKVGRFAFLDGAELTPKNASLAALKRERVSQRLIGDFGFTDVGRSFDGAHYSYSPSDATNITVVAAVPTRGVFQVDGWGWNKVAFAYAAYTHIGGLAATPRIAEYS